MDLIGNRFLVFRISARLCLWEMPPLLSQQRDSSPPCTIWMWRRTSISMPAMQLQGTPAHHSSRSYLESTSRRQSHSEKKHNFLRDILPVHFELPSNYTDYFIGWGAVRYCEQSRRMIKIRIGHFRRWHCRIKSRFYCFSFRWRTCSTGNVCSFYFGESTWLDLPVSWGFALIKLELFSCFLVKEFGF